MAALSCLHRGGGLRSLPRYLTYSKRAIPGARRVDDGAGVDFGIRGEPRCATSTEIGRRSGLRRLTVVWGSGASAFSVHVLREGSGWGQSSISCCAARSRAR